MAGIFAFAISSWLFEGIPLAATALVVIILQATLLPIQGSSSAYLSLFGSPVIVLFLGGTAVALALQIHQVDRILLAHFLRVLGPHPIRILLGVLLFSAILAMWLTNTSAAALVLALVLPMAAKLDEAPRFRKSLLLAVAFGSNIGGMATPVGTPPNMIAMGFMAGEGKAISFAHWFFSTLPLVAILLAGTAFILFQMFLKKTEPLNLCLEDPLPWTKEGVWTSLILVGTTCLWMTTGIHGVPEAVISLAAVSVLLALRLLKSSHLSQLPWSVFILVWGGLALGEGLTATGLMPLVTHLVGQNQWGGTVALLVLAMGMSAVMSNSATALALIPVAMAIAPSNPSIAVWIALACSCGMFLPISTPANALVFGHSWLTARDMVVPGALVTAFGLLCVIAGFFWIG